MGKVIYSVYKATCLSNNKSYIGMTKYNYLKRKRQHEYQSKHSPLFFHKALKKYGIDNFSWGVLAQTDTLLKAYNLETYLIKQHRSFEKGYNLTKGGKLSGNFLQRLQRLKLERAINTVSDQINFWIKYPFFSPKDKLLREALKTFNKKYTKFELKQNEKRFIKKLEASINTVQDQIDFWLLFPSTVPNIPELVTALKRKNLTNIEF